MSGTFAPDFRLLLDGQPAPAELRASISRVQHQAGLEGADRVEITLVDDRLRWLDHRLLRLDTPLALSLGYADGELEPVFVGEVVGQQASFPSGGAPALTISAQDARHRLATGTKARWFGIPVPSVGNYPLPDLATAPLVALESLLVPLLDPVGAALAVILGGVEAVVALSDPDAGQALIRKQAGESDYDLLARIARENGWDMLVEHTGPLGGHQLAFRSPLSRLDPDRVLEYGRNLIDFTPRLTTVGQVAAVTAYVYASEIKTTFTVTIGWDWDRMALTLAVVPSLVPIEVTGPSQVIIDEPMDPVSAPRRIVGTLIPRLNERQTGSGTVIGDPGIRPGGVLRLEGLGETFGGLYRVTSVENTIDGGGFLTHFDVRKDVWFGSIPKPAQGAVPVRVSAPFVEWSGRVSA